MELLSTLILGFLTLILFLSLKLHQYLKRSNANLPPGKTGWPFSGETLEFLSTGRKGTPETFFTDRMNRHSPEVFKTSLLGEKTAVLCGAAGNKFIFSNEKKLVKSWWPLNVEKIFPNKTSTSEESDKMRKLFPGIAKPNALRKYVGIMDAIAKQHLGAHWDNSEGAEITVLPLAKNFTFAVACRLFLSIADPSHVASFEKPFHLLHAGMISLPINLPGTPINRAIRASNTIRKEVLKIIGQRKRRRRLAAHRDILDHLLEATTDEDVRLTLEPDDIANKIMAFLLGGHDTTSSVITFIIKYLAELPEIYDNVFKEQREIAEGKEEGELLNWDDLQKMKYTWNVACEVLRLAPPIHGTFREAIADFTYAGFSIPKGWKLYWTVHSTHKNPDYFEEPDKFEPSRFEGKGPIPYSYVPFGGGPRMCPGQEYAKLKILVLMHNLVTNFKWEKVLPNEKIVFDPLPRPQFGLPVRMRRHSSLS